MLQVKNSVVNTVTNAELYDVLVLTSATSCDAHNTISPTFITCTDEYCVSGDTSAVGTGSQINLYPTLNANNQIPQTFADSYLVGQGWNGSDIASWAYYDDSAGGVTVDAAFTVSSPTVLASATATLPEPIANVSYSVSTPGISATTTATIPTPLADVAFTLSIPSVTANASVTLPNPSADISFTVNSASVSGVASATLPNPSASVSYTVSAPSVSANVSATLPGYSASVAFTVSSPGVSISSSVTLPQPAANVDFAVSAPQISVVAIVGGIAIIVDDETNINQRVLSNNINAPALSNNING